MPDVIRRVRLALPEAPAYLSGGMAADTLDRLLTTLAVRLHASSVCEVQQGWRLDFQPFETVVLHHVLRGSGAMRVGNGPWLAFAPGSMLVVPARTSHAIGDAGPTARVVEAEDRCAMLADGLVTFTAGDGSRDTLLLCGAVSASGGSGLGLFDLFRGPLVEDLSADGRFRQMFEMMAVEVASPNLGTRAMTEALMKGCLVALLRQHLLRDGGSFLLPALHEPRLARAVMAVIEDPAAPHSVGSLAAVAGMSRASFAGHFAQAFQQGPMEFVQKVRLRIAARLLTTTDFPLKVVARSAGYAGPAPFARAFRAMYGTDPSSYRSIGAEDAREPGRTDALLGDGVTPAS